MKLGMRCQKNLINPLGWKNLNEEYKIDHPVVICFGGDGVKNDRAANGFAKLISSNLGIRTGLNSDEIGLGIEQGDFPADILSVTYDGRYTNDSYSVQQIDYENGFADKPEGTEKEKLDYEERRTIIKNFFDIYFKDLIIDSNGNKLDAKTAMKNIRNVNIVSFCYGTLVVSQLEDIMIEEMEKAGYSEEEINMIQSQMFVIKASPLISLGASKSTSIGITSLDDDDSEVCRYKEGEFTNPELHKTSFGQWSELLYNREMHPELDVSDFCEDIGDTISYSENEFAFTTTSLCDFEYESHESKTYFSMADRENQGFISKNFGDCLPAVFTMLLNNGINNSVLNFKSDEFIPLTSAVQSREMIEKLLNRFQGHTYSKTMEEIYNEIGNMNKQYANSVSKESIENNKEYAKYVKQYSEVSARLKSIPQEVLQKMNEISFFSDTLMDNEFKGKADVKDKLVELLGEVKKGIGSKQLRSEEKITSAKEIESIPNLEAKLTRLKQEIENMNVKDEVWSKLKGDCDRLYDFGSKVLAILVDKRDKTSIEKLGGEINSKGPQGGVFGNGIEYVKLEFSKQYPEIAEVLGDDEKLRFCRERNAEMDR